MVWNGPLGFLLFILLVAANLQADGCSKSLSVPNNIVFSCESDPKPPRIGTNTFTVTLTSDRGQRLAGARVQIEGDMSHAGMSPVFGEVSEINPGQYRGRLELSMRGDWTILFHIKLASGQTLDRELKLRNVQAM